MTEKKWDRFWPALRCEQYLFYEKALVRTVCIAYNGFVVSDLLTGLVGSGLKIAGELFLVYEKRRWFRSNPDTKCCKCIAGLASVDMAVFQSKHLQTNTKSFSVVVGFSCIYGKKTFVNWLNRWRGRGGVILWSFVTKFVCVAYLSQEI